MNLYKKAMLLAHEKPPLRGHLKPILDEHRRKFAKVAGLKAVLDQFKKASVQHFTAFELLKKRGAEVGLKHQLDTRQLLKALEDGKKALKTFHSDLNSLQKFARTASLLWKFAFTFTYVEAMDFLGLPSGSAEREIKRAYRTLASKYHPDRHANDPPEVQARMTEMFQKLGVAYSAALEGPRRVERERGYRDEARRRYQYEGPDLLGEMFSVLVGVVGAILIAAGIQQLMNYLKKPAKASPKTETQLMEAAFKGVRGIPKKYQKVLPRFKVIVDKFKGTEEGKQLEVVYKKLEKHLKRNGPLEQAFEKIGNEISIVVLLAGK